MRKHGITARRRLAVVEAALAAGLLRAREKRLGHEMFIGLTTNYNCSISKPLTEEMFSRFVENVRKRDFR